MRELHIGTSGWLYDWNEEATLEWYIEESGLNAVELNSSFYRFPFKNQVKTWSIKGKSLRWSIKVHRSITHMRKLSREALSIWQKFHDLFKPMNNLVDFYLFQLPPNYTCKEENLEKIRIFHGETGIGFKMAVEFRHNSCFNNNVIKWAEDNNIMLVSIDSPIVTWITTIEDTVYLRTHGRKVWYGYEYSEDELREIAGKIIDLNPRRVYVFFNNNHWMLDNARFLKKILEETSRNGEAL